MAKKPSNAVQVIPVEFIERKIYLVRGCKVMLDSDLADSYQMPTQVLNQAVRRNLDRFPAEFMFQLNDEELENWRSQIVTSNPGVKMGLRRPPCAFTEHGVAMLSSVLTSKRAVDRKLEDVERIQQERKAHIQQIYDYIQPLLEPAPKHPKRRIGFATPEEREE